MDVDKGKKFINQNKKSSNESDVATAAQNVSTVTTNGSNGSNNSNHQSSNGTIGSNSEESIEPPKQPFNNCNEYESDIHENNVYVDKVTDSESFNRSSEDCRNDLSDKMKSNHVVADDAMNQNSCDVCADSKLLSLPQAISKEQINHNNGTSSSDNDKNKLFNHHHRQFDDCNGGGGGGDKANHNEKTIDTSGHCINSSDNIDIDNKTVSTTEQPISNELIDSDTNLLSISKNNSSEIPNKCPVSLKQHSSEDFISSTETFSSDSIDVKPNKLSGSQSQTASESDEIVIATSCDIEKDFDDRAVPKSQSSHQTMDDDNSLKMPLLGKQKTNGNNTIDYNAIERQKSLAERSRNQRRSSNLDGNGKQVAYNEYVNFLCDINKTVDDRRGRDEKRPLLQQSMSCDADAGINLKYKRKSIQKPRSIVKSPSTQNFGSNSSDKFYEANRKPRLSIQCTGSDPERPVLHVQFLSQQEKSQEFDLKRTVFNVNPYSPSSAGDHESYQNSSVSHCDSTEKQPEELINQKPTRGILRTPRLRNSISSSSSGSSSSSSSDSSSSDDVSQFAEVKAPDGGWGWVVVFASFMVNLIADGITFSFGVIYVELLKYFGEGKAKTAWIGSLFMAMPLLSGPVASFLTDRYGCRKVTIVGSILASIGFFVSSFTDSIEMLFLTFGIFAGFGLSLCYVAAVVIVAYYFDKRRSFATGLSVCGSGIGTFLFAPLTQLLIDEYGWRGTTLILSGMFLNMTVCGMLMKDLEWTTYKSKQKAKLRRKRNKLGISADSFSVSNSTNTGGTTSNLHKDDPNGTELDRSDENHGDNNLANQTDHYDDPRLFSSLITLPTFVKNGEKVPVEVLELMSANKNVHSVLLKNYPGLAHSRSFSQPLTSSRHSNGPNLAFESSMSPTSPSNENENGLSRSKSRRIRNEQAFLTWLKQDPRIQHTKDVQMIMNRNPTAYLKDLRMHRHSLTYRGAMLNINRYRLRASSCPDIYRNSMTTIAKEKTQWGQGFDEFKSVLMDMLDFSFFADIRFTLFALSNFLLYAWYDVPYVYLADNAVEIGFSETDASILISLIGIVNMVGEIILGWFGDQKFITAGMIYAVCMVFCGLVTGLVPLLPTYTGLSILSGLFGMFIAANYALTSIILVELISLERFTNAYGLLLLVQGIANLIGPPLAGWITDLTGNYDLAFYLAGIFIAVSGLLMMFLPARGKIRKYRAFRRRCQSSGEDEEDDDDDDDDEDNIDIERCANGKNYQTVEAPKSALKNDGNASHFPNSSKKNQI